MANKSVWVTGYHAVQAVLKNSPERALTAHIVINPRNRAQAALIEQIQALGLGIQGVDKRSLARLCGNDNNQGIALQVRPRPEAGDNELQELIRSLLSSSGHQPLLLVLDQVQDPHNFGACLRTADAAGVDGVIVARDNACPMTSVVQKVASGAAETLPIFRVTNLARTIDSLKKAGIWLIGTSDKASHTLYQQDLTGPVCLVMGAEGKGMRQLTEKKCDTLVRLPMAGKVVSSLNVSVAAGVCLYEVVRQRTP